MAKYLITGFDRMGKRFRIETDEPRYYNIWRGTLWKLNGAKRKKIDTYWN